MQRFIGLWFGKCSASLAVAAILGAAVGCGESGPATAHLQGTVMIGGQPLPADASGNISFTSTAKEQAPSTSAEIVAGKYDCLDAPEGKVRVSFNIFQLGEEYTSERGEKARKTINLTPDKYMSGIELEVTGDKADQDFNLEK